MQDFSFWWWINAIIGAILIFGGIGVFVFFLWAGRKDTVKEVIIEEKIIEVVEDDKPDNMV